MKKNGFFRKLNFLIALGGIFAALAFYGCSNLLASDSANDAPANSMQAKEGYGIVSGTLPSENNSASARTAMPTKSYETSLSYKVFAQSGSQKIEANVNDESKTFSISLPFGTWKITANGLLPNGRIIFTQTRTVTLNSDTSYINCDFDALSYSTNPEDGDGEISLSVSFPAKSATSLIKGIEYTLSKGENKIVQNVSDAELGAGNFKIEHTTENLGAWHLTINFYGDFSNLVYRIDQTVNLYANLTTDKFEGSAPYISSGAIALTDDLLKDFQNTTLYVNASSGKDTNTGTQFDPLQTLNRAVELVNNSTRDSSTEFRIFLQTDVTDGAALELESGKKLAIASAGGTAHKITSLGRTFVVAATSELAVRDLKFEKLRFEVSGTFTMDGGAISGNEFKGDTSGGGGAIFIATTGKAIISGVTISENSVDNVYGKIGGGIFVGGALEMEDCTIEKNEADSGGGIFLGNYDNTSALAATLKMNGGIIRENTATTNGGGVVVGEKGAFTMEKGTFSGNTANTNGGAVCISGGTFEIKDGTFSENSASGVGGAVYDKNGTLKMSGGEIKGNNAPYGGGICVKENATFTMENGTISKNVSSDNGGGVYVDGIGDEGASFSPTFTMTGGAISENTANYGGGVYVYLNGTLKMSGGEISDNTASNNGGAVYINNNASFTMEGGIISRNESISSNGGGIYIYTNGTFTMKNGTVGGNKAYSSGGAIYVSGGKFIMSDTATISENKASNAHGGGICIINNATFEMNNGTISGNTANLNGGAVYVNSTATFEMNNGIISENTANRGGGVYVKENATFTMDRGTISENTANDGGGVYVTGDESTSGTFTMEGGTFSGNKATEKGNGAYVNPCAFKMSGAAKFAEDNDVYLNAVGSLIPTITVAGSLTAESPVATITPSAYTDREVLSADTGVTITQDICNQFALTPPSDGTDAEWKIVPAGTAFGVLRQKSTEFYVRGDGAGWYADNSAFTASAGSDTTGNGTKTKPFATIQKAIDEVIAQNDGADDYTIFVDGTLTQSAAVTAGMADLSKSKKNLTLTIKSLSETTKATLDAKQKSRVMEVLSASGVLNLTLENLVIKGGKTATGSGGGIEFYSTGGSLTMKGCEVRDNEAFFGGGIYASSALEMESCTVSGNTAATDGGGINLDANALKMKDCEITGNTATRNGGGIYIEGSAATLTMENGKISENIASGDGGGIYVSVGTFTMNGGTIEKNEANYGGGVYVNGGAFNMSGDGSAITDNKTRGNATSGDGGGGGVYLYGGTFDMSGGTISGNETAGSLEYSGGGGVYVYNSGTFSMTGGTVSGNKADSGNGHGAFIQPNCTFKMSGASQFAESDDVYLYAGATLPTITVAGALTAASPVATIKLPDTAYTAGKQVLRAASGTITQGICDQFALSDENWQITPSADGTNGVLMPDSALYVISGGDDTTGDGTKAKPFATLQKAFDTIKDRNDSTASYTIRISGTVVGGCIVDETSAANVLITGTSADTDILDGGGTSSYVFKTFSSFPIEIKNVKIKGGSCISVNNDNASVTLGSGAEVYVTDHTGLNIPYGTFILDGGAILDDGAGSNGNPVRFSGEKFIMKSGTIEGRALQSGGCVFINGGEFIMEGGTISGGTATYFGGGGVYINSGKFTMRGGTISGCRSTTTDTSYGGGGVCAKGSDSYFTMEGGTITGNTSGTVGGGVYNNGTFEMSGGEITGNTATTQGGGVYNTATATFTPGGTVSGNTPDDVYPAP